MNSNKMARKQTVRNYLLKQSGFRREKYYDIDKGKRVFRTDPIYFGKISKYIFKTFDSPKNTLYMGEGETFRVPKSVFVKIEAQLSGIPSDLYARIRKKYGLYEYSAAGFPMQTIDAKKKSIDNLIEGVKEFDRLVYSLGNISKELDYKFHCKIKNGSDRKNKKLESEIKMILSKIR